MQRVEERFRLIHDKYTGLMQCGRGCALCCHGLFDISIPDALRVAQGFAQLPKQIRTSVLKRAAVIHGRLKQERPDLHPPYFLNQLSEEEIDHLVEAVGNVRCPFLDLQDGCLIYEFRPLACVLEGLPMVDSRDGLFGDWCELNFQQGISAETARDLCLDYCEIQVIEQAVSVFIPSVVDAVVSRQWPVLPEFQTS